MKQWYAVQTKPRQEALAEANLERQGFAPYLPRICSRKRRRDQWSDVVEPLFPRYLFVHVDAEELSLAPVRSTIGVAQLVRFGTQLRPVPDAVIEYLRAEENADTNQRDSEGWPHRPGDHVEIVSGPFAGLTGVYQELVAEHRAMLLVELLGRCNQVHVEMHSLGNPIAESTHRNARAALQSR